MGSHLTLNVAFTETLACALASKTKSPWFPPVDIEGEQVDPRTDE